MKTLLSLGAAVAIASLTGCASSSPQNSGNNAAYTSPRTFNENNTSSTAGINTSNPGSMYNPNAPAEDNNLFY